MAIRQINTQSQQYQTALTRFDEIIDFYKPLIREYFALRSERAKEEWRARDPILRRFLLIAERVGAMDDKWQ